MLMGVSKTTVNCWIVASTICVHCNSLKPILTEENKWAWVEMAMHFSDHEDLMKYQDMHDQIHLDEKWFFLTWEKEISCSQRRKTPSIASNTNITHVQNLGGMASSVFGVLGIGNQPNGNQRTGLREHWCGRTKW